MADASIYPASRGVRRHGSISSGPFATPYHCPSLRGQVAAGQTEDRVRDREDNAKNQIYEDEMRFREDLLDAVMDGFERRLEVVEPGPRMVPGPRQVGEQ